MLLVIGVISLTETVIGKLLWKVLLEISYTLLTAPQSVSTTHAHVAKAQLQIMRKT